MKSELLAVTLAFALAAPFVSAAGPPDLSGAPVAIQELAAEFRGKSSEEVHAIILKRLGAPLYDLGDGNIVQLWETCGGALVYHNESGPSFRDYNTEREYRLVRARNTVRDNLFREFWMLTLPINGTSHGLGDLEITANMTYRYKGLEKDEPNFFMRRPAGRVVARYVEPVTAETALESLDGETAVARLTFLPEDGAPGMTFLVTSSWEERRLILTVASPWRPPPFQLSASWKSDWE